MLWELHRTPTQSSSPGSVVHLDDYTLPWMDLRTFLDSFDLYSGRQLGADCDDMVDTRTLVSFFNNFSVGTLFDLASSYKKAPVFTDGFKLNKLRRPLRPIWMTPQSGTSPIFTSNKPTVHAEDEVFKKTIPVRVAEALSELDNLFIDITLHSLSQLPVWIVEKPFEENNLELGLIATSLRNEETPPHLVAEVEKWVRKVNLRSMRKNLNNLNYIDGVRALTANGHCSTQTLLWFVENTVPYMKNETVRFNVHTHPNLPSEVRLQVWFGLVDEYKKGEHLGALMMAASNCLPSTVVMDFLTNTVHDYAFSPHTIQTVKSSDNINLSPTKGFGANVGVLGTPLRSSPEKNETWEGLKDEYSEYSWLARIIQSVDFSSEDLATLHDRTIEANNGYDSPDYLILYGLLGNLKTPKRIAEDFLSLLPYLEDYSERWAPVTLQDLQKLAEERTKKG